MKSHILPVSLLTIALTGCVLPPRLPPQATPLAANRLGLDGPAQARAPDGWWQAFGDPQLDRLIGEAFAANPRLAEAAARVRMAQSQADADSAASKAGISLDGNEIYQRFPEHDIIPPPLGGGRYWRGQIAFNLAWDLDFFGRQAAVIARSNDLSRAAALDLEVARHVLAGAMAQAYVDLDRAWTVSDIAQRAEQQRQSLLDLATSRVDAGLDDQSRLRGAEAALAQAHLARLQAQANIAIAVHRLAALTGRGANAYADIGRPHLDLARALPLPEQLPFDLLSRRPDVLAARARVDAASQGQAAAKAAFYPDINLTAFAGFGAIGLDNLLRSDDRAYGIGPALHLPIFESGQLKAGYRAASAESDAAIADYNQTVLQAVQQTADQLSLIASYKSQIEQSMQSLAASKDAYRIAQLRYRAGLINRIALLDAETAVLDAHHQQINLVAAQAVARVTLLLALGGSFDPASINAVTGAF
ncbi:MAG: efflux transporter outer membrane subunit [Stenotrophobium sp.]